MKTITPYLLWFALGATLLTIAFRFFLSYGIQNHASGIIATTSIVYGVGMFAMGFIFGKRDAEFLPISDVGFRFYFTTYLVHNSISILWVGLGFGSQLEHVQLVVSIALFWGALLILHFVLFLWAKRNSIDSLRKDEIFD